MEVLYQRCCGLDVHKETVVACLRIVCGGEVTREVRTFETTMANLMALSEWLAENGCTHGAMEATGRRLKDAPRANPGAPERASWAGSFPTTRWLGRVSVRS
jgi:hypothetical protein